MRTAIFILLAITFTTSNAFAGNNFGKIISLQDDSTTKWGTDSAECVKNISLYRGYFKQKDFKAAYPFWQKSYDICPKARKYIFRNGEDMLLEMIKNTKDPKRKNALVDSLFQLYDRWIENWGDKGSVLGYKGIYMMKYREDTQKEEAYQILKQSLELEKGETNPNVIQYLYKAGFELMKEDKVEKAEMYNLYEQISEVFKYQQENKPEYFEKYYSRAQDFVNKIFEAFADCPDFIDLNAPKLDANPKDAELMQKIVQFMEARKCTDKPLYFKAAKGLYEIDPTASAAAALAKMELANGNHSNAIKYYQEAIDNAVDNDEKAKYHLELAEIYYHKLKQYENARTHAKKAASLKSGWGDPYLLLGDMYAGTAPSCGDTDCTKKVGFWAAVDMYQKAKSVDPSVADKANKRAGQYANYFPAPKDCFFEGLEEGQSYTIPCWIGETTTVRFKK